MPNKNTVHHFHPIAFVEHMKKIYGETKGECYCNRELTTEEFKTIFIRIRKSEKLGNGILNHNNCNIPTEDKTFKRLVDEFNKTAKKYGINQCIQKIHFISQIYWESARFTTGLEFASGSGYNPGQHDDAQKMGNTLAGDGPKYKGRGFMQLTWRDTQIKYLKHVASANEGVLSGKTDAEIELRSNNYEKYISDNLGYAMDSAGWFWSNYKKIAFNSKSSKTKYAEILGKTLNEVALKGDKYTDIISIFVNGGGNGKSERRKYYSLLKNTFKYDFICSNNKNKIALREDESPWMIIALKEYEVYLGKGEKQSPLKEKIFDYFDDSSFTDGNNRTHWCGAFVNWCLKKSNFKTPSANAAARGWSPIGNYEYYWENGLQSDKPFYGAIAVINWTGGGQHVAFVIGETNNGRIAILGGNQGGHEGGGITISSALKSEIQFYMYPNNYQIPESAYNLSKEDVKSKLTYNNTH